MLDSLLHNCKTAWSEVKDNKKHPFRFFYLATIGNDGRPSLRTVVLRDFDSETLFFSIFTDLRSKKVKELGQDSRAQFLFYDAKKMLQVTVNVSLVESINNDLIYKSIPEQSKKDYATKMGPGSEISSPEKVEYDFSKGYFTQLVFKAETIEYLQLKRPNHIRAFFTSETNWEGTFLIP
ncbi:pyridoxamine 5'-phosphate oxidase family protein [Flavobacteriaceae bacterium]|nr:pyridoxamine 5'-phosphate oxidase family protein [Flavobacteriaceae bacterium]MDC0132552.1 pyridoxamine 5'-phosphate oxidase family protein [Flavobacteriaceae bacterium]